MSFIIDKQTVQDLNLLGKYDSKSIYRIYDKAKTRGGSKLMEQMFLHPLSDHREINERSAGFRMFMEHPAEVPFEAEEIDRAENFLSMPARGNRLLHLLKLIGMKSMLYIAGDRTVEKMGESIIELLHIFDRLQTFSKDYSTIVPDFKPFAQKVSTLLSSPSLKAIFPLKDARKLRFSRIVESHYVLTKACLREVTRLMDLIYLLDLQTAVASVATERGFHTAKALDFSDGDWRFKGENIFHPAVTGAKGNDVTLDYDGNMLFLTGANMAGKSTFMKSIGTALYLAHMGFPVPAKSLEFCVMDGLFTSINVSDDLTKGYSHYYAEVMRVKKVAEYVAKDHNLFIILDELFKGTNVKDALDATSAVLKALSIHRNCFFIVSTHLLEAADALRDLPNVQYRYLPTEVINGIPTYTYRLTEGISDDRQGLMLIRKEKIVERLRGQE